MNLKNYFCVGSFATIVIGGGMLGAGFSTALAIESSEGMEVMTRGPVHEAFAETVAFDPVAGIIVSQMPPAMIEEVMPDQRPAGDNVAWIPGYWAWDEEQSDFLWISGIWRNLPPGREWVPGYWSAVDTRHQWTSGYWQDAETTEVTYLPEPPRSVERGPNIAASSDDQTWIPGSWQYQEDRYAWSAGYWVTARPNWCWTPSYYRWTRRGHVYVDGYWDYPVVNRGVIFAPVRFQRSYYERPDFYYSPYAVISLSVFSNHLFLRPNYCHYYFGDYYEPRYRNQYYASYDYGSRYRGYDPIYSHYRWENRHDRNWDRQRQDYYEYRRDNVDARPPRTWAALNERSERDRERGDYGVAERYDRVVDSRKEGRSGFQTVSNDERQRFVSQKNDIRNYGRERQQREVSGGLVRDDKGNRTLASREKASRSPVASKRTDRSEKNGGPPERLQMRTSEKKVMASKDNRGGNVSQAGRKDMDAAKANSREADKRGGNSTAKNMAEPKREFRTQPGQRRDTAASTKGKPQQATESNGRSNATAGGRSEMDRKATPSAALKGNAEPKRSVNPGERSVDKQRANNDRQPTEKRAESQNVQRREPQTPQRQAAPQSERKSAQSEVRSPSRQEAPSRKASAAPTRESSQKAAAQRVQPRPQQQAQPQRQSSPRPEPRQARVAPQRQKEQVAPQRQAARPTPRPQAQPAPQRQSVRPTPQRESSARSEQRRAQPERQQAAPQRVQPRPQQFQPQRQQAPRPQQRQAQPAPQRQRAEPAPQRQAARPQPQQSVPRQQKESRSSSRTEAAADPNAENRKKRQP